MIFEKLSKEQERQIPEYTQRWIKVGLSTEETDRAVSEAAIDKAYKLAGLTPPQKKFWARSPYEGAIMAARLMKYDDIEESREVSKEEIIEQLYKCAYGSHDTSWLGFYNYFDEVCNIKTPQLEGLTETSLHCGWWWPFDKAVIITPKPLEIHLDDDGQLHCENGMAIHYSDGWGVWAWHGVRVPQRLIEDPQSYTAKEILRESNVELRRCMIEKIGVQILEDESHIISSDNRGELYEIIIDNDEPIRYVKVINSTPEPDGHYKLYYLRVPPSTQTPHEGIAWGFGLDTAAYHPVIET